MHVLLDARVILGRKTGDRTYWLGLCRALPLVRPDWRFTLALDGEPEPGLLPAAPNLALAVATRPRGRLWNLVALPRLAAACHVDLVHLQYVAPPYLPVPFVTTVHDCSFVLFPETFGRFDGAWLRTLVPRAARRAAAVVGVSETTRRDLLRLYRLRPGRVHGIPNGIDPGFTPADPATVADLRRRLGLPAAYLLSVGLLQPRKNLVGLVTAYAVARREHGLELPLVITGRHGWRTEEVLRQVAAEGLGGDVFFTGYLADQDLPALYTGATLTCYPSFYEGFGLPPLESMACGTPAVVSTAPALVEVTGAAAPHLPADDTAGWAECLAALAADPERRAKLAAAGRARAAEFTWERSARLHAAVYERAARVRARVGGRHGDD